MANPSMADPRSRRRCRRVLLALTLGAGLLAMLGPAGAERPAGVALDYEVFAGGLRIARSDVELRLGDRSYTIALNAVPQGLLRWFSDWSFSAASNGAVKGRVDPKAYSTVNRKDQETKLRTLDYRPDGSIAVTMNPVEEGDPVPQALQSGTVDPLSSAVLMVAAVTAGEGCNRTVPVFDGRRRFDLVFADLGWRRVGASNQASFSGQTLLCRVRLERIAGSWQDQHSSGFWSRGAGDDDPRRREMDIFLAVPLSGGPMVPVRAEGTSSIGPILIHLRSAAALPGDTAERPQAR